MVFAQSTISQDWNFNVNPLIISFRLNQFTNGFTKTFIRKIWAEILLWYFRHDYCKWKILGKVGGCQRFIVKSFDPTLWITKFCCRVVPDDRFGVLNNPTCTNVGFSLSSLSREEGIWRKGTTKFSCSHLAGNIECCLASCCAKQPPVSIGGSVPCYGARKKGGCIGRYPYSNQERGTYISCNLRSTIYVFPGYIPEGATGRHVTRWEKVFLFSF